MISMTWPQYLRRECSFTAKLSPQENELLSTLLLRHPVPVATSDLIEAMWPDPDSEPGLPEARIGNVIASIRRKIGWGRIASEHAGYRLCQGAVHD
jgi:DNA-binding response OmpR family regulator